MSYDITNILRDWKYDPDNSIRVIKAEDGREVMQVRQPLGIEQYELSGRPDGKHPFGRETVLEELTRRKEAFELEHGSDGETYTMSKDEVLMLQNEGALFYYRYLHLFQIADYERTINDTRHNLALCDFIELHTEDKETAHDTLQYKPYILRMNAISRAMVSLKNNQKREAQKTLEEAIKKIKEMEEVDTPAFQFEKIRSLNYLRVALKQVLEKQLDPAAKLRQELNEAIEAEEYERAARIRDRLREFSDE